MRMATFLVALALSAAAPAALLAQVEVTTSSPAAGTEARAPRTVTLTFSQPVDQATAAASIVMTAMPGVANHGEMAIRAFTASWSADDQTMTLTLRQPLRTGTYEVRWQGAADDGELRSGTVEFVVL